MNSWRWRAWGRKRPSYFYEKLGITNLADLEAAAQAHTISPLKGFGDKTESNILEGIEFLKKSTGRFLLGEMLPLADQMLAALRALPEVERADVAGSLRRRKQTIGDLDFLVISSQPDKVMAVFRLPAGGGEGPRPRADQILGAPAPGVGHGPAGHPAGELRRRPATLFRLQGTQHRVRQMAIDQGYKLNEVRPLRP